VIGRARYKTRPHFLGGEVLKIDENIKGIDINISLDDTERALLSSCVKTQAFDVLQKLMEDIVRDYNARLMNTDPIKKDDVLINHLYANAVGGFYVALMARIKEECGLDQYNNRSRDPVNDMQIPELR
jgi:hypothetical protein